MRAEHAARHACLRSLTITMTANRKSPANGPFQGLHMHADDDTLRALVSVKPLEWEHRSSGNGGEIWIAEVDGGEVRYVITLDGSERDPFMVSRSTALTPFGLKCSLNAAQEAANEDNRRRVLENLVGVLACDLEKAELMRDHWKRFAKAVDALAGKRAGRGRSVSDPEKDLLLLKTMAKDLKQALAPMFDQLDVDLNRSVEHPDVEQQIAMLFGT
jgi:hypothetical protein